MQGGASHLQYYEVSVGYKWFESNSGNLIAQGAEKSEAIIQDQKLLTQKDLPMVKGHRHSIPVTQYDPEFWKRYLLKDQIPLDSSVIKGLEYHQVSIEDQFAGNSQEWWNPVELKKILKDLQVDPPKPSLTGNAGFHLKGFEHARTVSVAGDFNNWNPVQYFLKKDGDGWSGKLNLPAGTYEQIHG